MPFSIMPSYQNPAMTLSTAYKSHASASKEKHVSRFKTSDGDTVNISEEAYILLETNITDRKESHLKRRTDRN